MSVPIARAMAFGGFFEMLGCREALGGQPLHPSAASFCNSAASPLAPVRCVVRYFVYFAVQHRDSLACLFFDCLPALFGARYL